MRQQDMSRYAPFAIACACAINLGLPLTLAQPEAPPQVQPAPAEVPASSESTDPDLNPTDAPAAEVDETVDLLFTDFDIVVSAGRHARPVNMASAPVSVLTADDIHYSGLTDLPELFNFVPGMDVLRIDRNRYAIGIRGLHHEFADRTLVLIDGRNAASALFGGVDFQSIPFFTEDLSRIEFVRGPGGAAWGPNAFNGVINVLHKPIDETLGVLLSATIDEYGDVYSHIRWGARDEKLAWRFSLGHSEAKSSEDAIDGDDFDSDDFSRSLSFTGDAQYDFNEETKLTFGLGYKHLERGSFEFLGINPASDERLDYTNAYVKLAHDFGGGAQGYIQWYGTFENVNRPSLWKYDSTDNNVEAQLTFTPASNHTLTLGASARFVTINSEPDRDDALIPDQRFNEQWAGVFGIDTWDITNRFTLETQLRADWYSETHADWSGRLSGLYAVDADKQHVLRVSLAKAFRAPQVSIREIETSRFPLPSPPLPPGLFGLEFEGTGDIDNEETYAVEAGYYGRFSDQLTFRADLYYQWYTDLVGAVVLEDPLALGRNLIGLESTGDAEAHGAELELAYTHEKVRLSAWYTYNNFDLTEDGPQSVRALLPARHKVGATARWRPDEDWTLAANYRWTDTTRADGVGSVEIPASHRLDLTAALAVLDGKGEIQFGVWDVLEDVSDPVLIGGTTAGEEFETPGRTFFVRFQLRF